MNMCMNNEKIVEDASCSLPKRKNETYLGILFFFSMQHYDNF